MLSKYTFINELLFSKTSRQLPDDKHQRAFLVHASIIQKLKDLWQVISANSEWEIFDYALQIGEKSYDMRIAIVTQETRVQIWYLNNFIKSAQFSIPWENNPTLFTKASSFHVLQEYINDVNLQEYVLKIEDRPGINANDEMIRVVTFKPTVNLNAIKSFKYISRRTKDYHYYMAHAFPWLQPCWLKQTSLDTKLSSVFEIVLTHLGGSNNFNGLNILDLLSLRMVLSSGFRNQSAPLKHLINSMLEREIAKHIENDHLTIDQYLIDQNILFRDFITDYLVYEFQNYFETVEIDLNIRKPKPRENVEYACTQSSVDYKLIHLIHERNVRYLINRPSNKTNLIVDGSSYDRMGTSLFLDLVECPYVTAVRLDTNHPWTNDECDLNRSISTARGIIDVHLIGNNPNRFIEDFVASLKMTTFKRGRLNLHINCHLNDYLILDSLIVPYIVLNNVKMNSQMLTALHNCSLRSKIVVSQCTFENTLNNWKLFNSLVNLTVLTISEDEGTWQSMFDFILDEMAKSNTKEYKFDEKTVHVLVEKLGIIILGKYTFTLDEFNSKLEIRDQCNDIVDLYYLKFILFPDDKSDYDFYQ